MTKISKATMARIEAQAKEKEEDFLMAFLLDSDDENVIEALSQALAVVKLIFSEEIATKVNEYRDDLISEEKDSIARRKARNERLAAKSRREQIANQAVSDDWTISDWSSILDELKASDHYKYKLFLSEKDIWKSSNIEDFDRNCLKDLFKPRKNKNNDPFV